MFNNLIESTSHRKEYKRRGSFFLITTATYALMLVLTGIASIYAYDARLEDQTYQEVVTMLPIPEPARVAPAPTHPDRNRAADNNRSNIPERAVAMLGTDRPEVPPREVSATPNTVQPLPDGLVRITGRDWNPPMPEGGGGSSTGGSRVVTPPRVIVDDDLPPPPPPPPSPKVVKVSKILNSQALVLPKPKYPPLAIQIRLQGTVQVQVLIDEGGKVISAKALGGHPMLITEATRAAFQARFSPTTINDQPVKVSGVIIYNFVMQQ